MAKRRLALVWHGRGLTTLMIVLNLVLACGCDKGGPTPPGPFRLSGSITDATSAAPVPGAVVEAVGAADESQTPFRTLAGSDGQYVLSAVPAVVSVRVTQVGYLTAFTRVKLTTDTTLNFTLTRVSN